MANGLQQDGINDYATFPNYVVAGDFTVTGKIRTATSIPSGQADTIFGSNSSNFYYVLITDARKIELRGSGGTALSTGVLADATDYDFTLERTGSTLTCTIGAVSVSLTDSNTLTYKCWGRINFGHYNAGIIHGIWAFSQSGETRSYDFDQSTGSTVPESVGGLDATLVNSPTDDSQWVDLGGGGTTHEVSLIESVSATTTGGAEWDAFGSVAEAVSAVAGQGATAGFESAVAETIATAAVQAGVVEIVGYVAAGISMAETPAANADYSGEVSESAVVAGDLSVTQAASVDIAEPISHSDANSVTLLNGQINVDVSNVLAVVDSRSVQSDASVSVAETADLNSDQSITAEFATALAEVITATDLRSIGQMLGLSISEALASGSDQSLLVTIDGSITEGVGLAINLSATADISVDAVFNTALIDAVLSQAIYAAGYTDTVQITDTPSVGVSGQGIGFATPTIRTATLKTHCSTVSIVAKARVAVLK